MIILVLSIVERYLIQCPLFEVSVKGALAYQETTFTETSITFDKIIFSHYF